MFAVGIFHIQCFILLPTFDSFAERADSSMQAHGDSCEGHGIIAPRENPPVLEVGDCI